MNSQSIAFCDCFTWVSSHLFWCSVDGTHQILKETRARNQKMPKTVCIANVLQISMFFFSKASSSIFHHDHHADSCPSPAQKKTERKNAASPVAGLLPISVKVLYRRSIQQDLTTLGGHSTKSEAHLAT